MRGYDQWKTASPYDDEPDVFDEAHRFLKTDLATTGDVGEWALWIIEGLLDALEENGVPTK